MPQMSPIFWLGFPFVLVILLSVLLINMNSFMMLECNENTTYSGKKFFKW